MLREVKREKENKTLSQWKFNQLCYVRGQNLTNGVIQAFSSSKLSFRFLFDVLSVSPHLNSNITNSQISLCLRSVVAIMFISFGRVKQSYAESWEVDAE